MTQPSQLQAEQSRAAGHDRRPTDSSRDSSAGEAQAIDADGLRLTYPDGTEAVEDVTLTVPRGQFFGFLGPNGAGKTTTIKMLATLLDPTGGTARVNGFDVVDRRSRVRASIGYMAQSVSVDPELTARENLQFSCAAYGVPAGERADRIDELLTLVDLADVADDPAGNFSGGMQKRLDAATALVHDPELVFLDEPTTGLDPEARNRLWAYFRRINDDGTTIFLTTQYLEEADALCDRLAVIRDGTIVADDAPANLKRRVGGEVLDIEVAGGDAALARASEIAREAASLDQDASVATDDGRLRVTAETASDDATALLVALADAGVDVTGFDVEEPTLDDVFLAIADVDGPGLADEASVAADELVADESAADGQTGAESAVPQEGSP